MCIHGICDLSHWADDLEPWTLWTLISLNFVNILSDYTFNADFIFAQYCKIVFMFVMGELK